MTFYNFETIYKGICQYVNTLWTRAAYFDSKSLGNYKISFEYSKHSLKALRHSKTENGVFLTTDFDLMSWEKFECEVRKNNQYHMRLDLLEKAEDLFIRNFDELPVTERKCLAGDSIKIRQQYR